VWRSDITPVIAGPRVSPEPLAEARSLPSVTRHGPPRDPTHRCPVAGGGVPDGVTPLSLLLEVLRYQE